jgi:hypothetical protein
MIDREIEEELRTLQNEFPIIAILGPHLAGVKAKVFGRLTGGTIVFPAKRTFPNLTDQISPT